LFLDVDGYNTIIILRFLRYDRFFHSNLSARKIQVFIRPPKVMKSGGFEAKKEN